jgi:hypothetical protein
MRAIRIILLASIREHAHRLYSAIDEVVPVVGNAARDEQLARDTALSA